MFFLDDTQQGPLAGQGFAKRIGCGSPNGAGKRLVRDKGNEDRGYPGVIKLPKYRGGPGGDSGSGARSPA